MNWLRASGPIRSTTVLIGGFLVTVAVVASTCIYGFVRLQDMNDALRSAAEGRGGKISLIHSMQDATRSAFHATFLVDTDASGVERAQVQRKAVDQSEHAFDDYLRQFSLHDVSGEEVQLLNELSRAAENLRVARERALVYGKADGDVGSSSPLGRELLLAQQGLDTALGSLLAFERRHVYSEISEVSANNKKAFRMVLAMFFFAFLTAFGVAWVVLRAIHRTEKLLFDEKNLAEATLNSISEGVITVGRNGSVTYINPVAEMLTGWHRNDARGRPLGEVYRLLRLEDRSPLQHPAQRPVAQVMRCEDATHLLVGLGGKEYEVEDSAGPMYDARGEVTGAVLVFRDVTAARELSRRLEWQAGHDALTGLANRAEFQVSLEEVLLATRSQGGYAALLMLDLDRFKLVNEACGHDAGDQLLRQIGLVIQGCLRESDVLARLGADEFAVLLRACQCDEAMEIARTIRDSIREFRFVWQDRIFTVGASVGVVSVERHGGDQAELMRAADLACNAAKEGGSDRIRLYDPARFPLERPAGMDMLGRIIEALDEDRFCLYRQRIGGLHSGTSGRVKYEILLRMKDEQRVLAPGVFLPVAERYGMMNAIDRWVVEHAFAFLQRTGADGENAMYSINLSGATLTDDEFLDFLREQLARQNVRPQDVCFEVTETVAIANLSNAAAFMRAAREIGFQFALDDFGTGMSSFAYLKHLPLDYVKIDGAFVRDIMRNPLDREIVESIVRISRALKVQTIAEYVEDEETMSLLASLGVDYGQGYGIHKPAPIEMTVAGVGA